MKEQEIDSEAVDGFNFVQMKSTGKPRKLRRELIRKLKPMMTVLERQMIATQQAYDKNYPDELDNYTDEDRMDLLDDENKTRRALFYKELFKIEMYYSAVRIFIDTNGEKDILEEMGMSVTEDAIKEVLSSEEEEEEE